jgi:hypothetical protein
MLVHPLILVLIGKCQGNHKGPEGSRHHSTTTPALTMRRSRPRGRLVVLNASKKIMQHVPETELERYLVQKASVLLFFAVFRRAFRV